MPNLDDALSLLASPPAAEDSIFDVVCRALTLGLDCRLAGVARLGADGKSARLLAARMDRAPVDKIDYALVGTPCGEVYRADPSDPQLIVADRLSERYPDNPATLEFDTVSYRGEAFLSQDRRPAGHVFVVSDNAITDDPDARAFFSVVAQRAGAEFNLMVAAAALKESERRFWAFAEVTSDWLWEMDEDLRFTWFSDRVKEVTGVDPEWHYGKTRQEIGCPTVPQEAWEQHLETLRQRKPYRNFVFCRRGPDGDKWMRSNGAPMFDDDGSFLGYVGTGTDITAEILADQRADRSRELLENAIESMAESFVLWDSEDRLVMCNERFREINRRVAETTRPGTLFEQHIRAALAEGLYPDAAGREADWLAERFRRHRAPGPAFELARQDGRWILIHEQRLPSGNIVTISTDITERKAAERRSHEAVEQAELANRTKSEFLANISHELRTPLNAIIGFSEIMKTEAFGPVGSAQYLEYVTHIHASGQHLLDLINDILDLSKIESGTDELHEQVIEIRDLAESVMMLIRARAHEGGIELDSQMSDDLPMLRADAHKLKQILVNLLSNAVKFTRARGTVTLKAWCSVDGGHVMQVIDSGIGIALENIPKALTPFQQIDSDLNRQHEGTGLGLPLTKSLVELHGGSLDLQSELGVGTTVTIRFPARRIVPPSGQAAATPLVAERP